ncbi:MAG TPA: protease pro-enzyme activation domain-containing protein [Solirubrobacteraceae bacterium]|nr:protease pro-enzyme activation domain-containing protein [Solirubrobacteraceae bacterium]
MHWRLPMTRVPRTLALAACAAAVIVACAPAASAAVSVRGVRVGSAAAIPAAARVLGLLAPVTKLDVTVALAPRDPAGLAAFASAVSTPGSPEYRQYLTVAQFASRFGPTPAQVASVRSSLQAHGLDPGPVTANGLAIPVKATAGALSSAFSIAFSRVLAPSGRVAFASTAAPLFDAGVARLVQGVVGLDTLSVPEPRTVRAHHAARDAALNAPQVVTGGPQPCAGASAAAPGQQAYTADQIAAAYSFPGLYAAGDLGAGQTVAVYELEPNDPNDIAGYQSCYGTSAAVSYVPVDGGAGTGAGTGEAALDIENVIGLAPKANIIVYQGPNSNSGSPGAGPYDVYNVIISQNRAKIITTSWGQCEPMEGSPDATAESTLFQEAAAQGQTVISAAGDNGAEDCFTAGQNLDTTPAVDDPSSQPFVTGVGGTSMAAPGPPPTQAVWNNGGNLGTLLGTSAGAGGGGISAFWKMPSYQSGAPSSLHVINADSTGSLCGATSGYCRQVPDVSANADPFTGYLIYYQGAWGGIGGTSAAGPVWAALIALADASPACTGTSVGFANPALYRVAGGPQYAAAFNDVTAGNNDFTGTNGGKFAAAPGYDMASGLGTPIAPTLATALCETVTLANPGPQTSTLGHNLSLHLSATDAANASLTFRATGLPPGLAIDHTTGVIRGAPTQAGAYTVIVQATDTGGRTNIISFKWTIRSPTVLSATPPGMRCGVQARRQVAGQSGALRLRGSVRSGSVSVADGRGTLVTVKLSGTTVTVSAGRKVLGTVTAATGGLRVSSQSARAITLASGDRHFRLEVSYGGASSVTVKAFACSYYAPRAQVVTTRSGRAARGTLYLVSANGAAVAGASITITDGHRTLTARTGRSGRASFVLGAGSNRSVRAAYAGASIFAPANLTFRVRNSG